MKSLGHLTEAFGCRLADRKQQLAAAVRTPTVAIRARYDAAQSTTDNSRLWIGADGLSPDEANNAAVRMILRNRGEYVYRNNPRCRGMINTLAQYCVGTGPSLQLMLGDGPAALRMAERIETSYAEWAREVKLSKKLRMARKARAVRGELFLYYTYNPRLRHPVKLDVVVIDAARITGCATDVGYRNIDGVYVDEYDNRLGYNVTPAGMTYGAASGFNRLTAASAEPIGTFIDAAVMDHYFDDADRADQHRGVPDITPAIGLYEEGRRFRSAVLAASETAADYAMVIQSNATQIDPEGTDQPDPMDTIELERRMATVLPKGWQLGQTKAEQPTTTYREFSRELLSEVARCISMPLTIAALDSSDSNLSAAYLDFQVFAQAVRIDREDMTFIVDNILDKWLTIAADPQVGILGIRTPDAYPHKWFWPSLGKHADPLKVASAVDINLKNGTTTYAEVYGDDGKDWELMFQQRAREKARMTELGLTPADLLPASQPSQQAIDDPADAKKTALRPGR